MLNDNHQSLGTKRVILLVSQKLVNKLYFTFNKLNIHIKDQYFKI